MNEDETIRFLECNKIDYYERYLNMESVYYLKNLYKRNLNVFLKGRILDAINRKLSGM